VLEKAFIKSSVSYYECFPRCDSYNFLLANLLLTGHDGSPFFSPVAGHPKFMKATLFDIISLEHGPLAAGAELIAAANDVLESFPTLSQNYNITHPIQKLVYLILLTASRC